MIILEKVTSKGLSRIEITMEGDSIKLEEFLNDKSNQLRKTTQTPAFTDAQLEVSAQGLINNKGYIRVGKAGTLEADPSLFVEDDLTIRQLELAEFRKEYPHISLSNYPWGMQGKVEVYTEDVVIDGNLDLKEESDFTKRENEPIGASATNNMVFLKNLTVNGSIYSEDQDVDRALRVMGDLTAHNMIIGGSQIYIEGKTKIRDALILYPDVDLKINDIHSSLYIQKFYNNYSSINIQKSSFDYTMYFDDDLADEEKELIEEGETMSHEEKIEHFGVFYNGKKQTWINNANVLSEPEIIPFITDEYILESIISMIEDIEEE